MSKQNRTVGGWSVDQRDGRVIVQKAGAGGYAACETDVENIASAILAAFALDAADEREQLTRERDEAVALLREIRRDPYLRFSSSQRRRIDALLTQGGEE